MHACRTTQSHFYTCAIRTDRIQTQNCRSKIWWPHSHNATLYMYHQACSTEVKKVADPARKACDIFRKISLLGLLTEVRAAVCTGKPCLTAACHEEIRSSTPSPSFNFSYVTKAMAIDGTTFM